MDMEELIKRLDALDARIKALEEQIKWKPQNN